MFFLSFGFEKTGLDHFAVEYIVLETSATNYTFFLKSKTRQFLIKTKNFNKQMFTKNSYCLFENG